MRWHLFCRVIDNYGDAGVAWRLARQLNAAGEAVSLFIDDRAVLARLEARLDIERDRQSIDGVEVYAYRLDDEARPADVVVSIFGSDLSARYRERMAASSPAPLWVDLEYLSAEDWVADFHLQPSPEPQGMLVKTFFYPGFVDGTGGLGFEADIARTRRAFVEDADARHAFGRSIGLDLDVHARRASLFGYPSAPYAALFEAIASGAERWMLLVPQGVASAAIDAFFGPSTATTRVDRALTVHVHPFVSQDDYDRLLWICDVAFVRGEDSFVRAQCAALPFVWQPYPQAERTHDLKRAAFERLYDAGLANEPRAARQALWRAWNEPGHDVAAAWRAWRRLAPELAAHAEVWSERLTSRPPLVDRLREWVAARRANLLN